MAKRSLDIAIAVPALVVAFPVMIVVALIVYLGSRGPVILRQQRIGLDGSKFAMSKFRTMRSENPDGTASGRGEVVPGDPRLIPLGSLLRDWRLDELPQLFHVLSGRLSLVGPRPDLPANLPAYRDEDLVRFAMPPGCTAWTFTRGAFENDWATRQRINAEYVEQWSFGLDLKILLESAWVLITQRGTAPSIAEIPSRAADGPTRPADR